MLRSQFTKPSCSFVSFVVKKVFYICGSLRLPDPEPPDPESPRPPVVPPVLELFTVSSNPRASVRDRRLERNCCSSPSAMSGHAEVITDPVIRGHLRAGACVIDSGNSCAGMVREPPWSFIFQAL